MKVYYNLICQPGKIQIYGHNNSWYMNRFQNRLNNKIK